MTDPANGSPDQRRTVILAALVLVAVALVGLGAGYLLSVAEGGSDGSLARRTPSSSPTKAPTSPTATPPRPTVRAASEIERGLTEDLGYVLGARTADDGMHVSFDRVQLLRGDAAETYAREHDLDEESARRGLIVNENPRTRDLVLAPDIQVFGGVQLAASSDLEPVPLQRLLDALDTRGGSLPLELRYDKLGYVVEVREKRFG